MQLYYEPQLNKYLQMRVAIFLLLKQRSQKITSHLHSKYTKAINDAKQIVHVNTLMLIETTWKFPYNSTKYLDNLDKVLRRTQQSI